jgi:hypothetical protein
VFHLPVELRFAVELAFYLVASHFVADFVLTPRRRVESAYARLAQGLTSGFLVMMATGQVVLAVVETGLFCLIEYARSQDWISLNREQLLHLLCKVLWWVAVVWGLV